jgi:dUTPase
MLKMFIDQDYQGHHTLVIFNNSPVEQSIVPLALPPNKKVLLFNQHIDSVTDQPYDNLGAIYRDALACVPHSTEIINIMDDDDLYLPYHITEGVRGYSLAIAQDMLAYKPKQSYFRTNFEMALHENTFEPSIFVSAAHVADKGFETGQATAHMAWLKPLWQNGKLFVDPEGMPTFIYDWSDHSQVHHISGDGKNDASTFANHKAASQDHGDMIIEPWTDEQLDKAVPIIPKQDKF